MDEQTKTAWLAEIALCNSDRGIRIVTRKVVSECVAHLIDVREKEYLLGELLAREKALGIYTTEEMHEMRRLLVGKKVTKILMEPQQHEMMFETAEGTLVHFETEGDCCSESWFAELLQVDQLLGHRVIDAYSTNMADISTNPEDGNSRQEVDSIYSFQLATTGGECTVIFRNSSNGYYGGVLHVREGVVGDQWDSTKSSWAEITDDWTAYG